jgi:uncharacterized repeat protein (TIGR03803 family)
VVLHSFTGAFGGQNDGSAPVGEMVAIDGVLYGTTSFGGAYSGGTVFSFNPATGKETVIYSFGAVGGDGSIPSAGLTHVGDSLYGTTSQGGAAGLGTVFRVELASGIETVLHEFAGGEDGASPFAPLTLANGLLYGTTYFGGPANNGTVFRIDPVTAAEVVLHAFEGPPFSGNPSAGLAYHHFHLYGTTAHGGRHCSGGCGTVFRVDTRTGRTRDLYRFSSPSDGEDPEGSLVLHQGILYGTTLEGGAGKVGTVFAIDPKTGTKTTLHDFKFQSGANPGNLVWFHGSLYGTTRGGGGAGQGTVFKLTP